MTTPTVDRQIERRLADAEVRYTKGRRVVIRAIADADGPRSAAELSKVIGESVPLSSLYRSLAVLEEAGVLAPHFSSPGLTRYELAEWLSGHHHHLVCISCGSVQDIEISDDVEARLRGIITEIADAASFKELNHVLEIEGHCTGCV